MNSFDREYYILKKEDSDVPTRLEGFHETRERNYRKVPCAPDSPPLTFFNGARRDNRQHGIAALPEPRAVMFDGKNLLVRKPIRDSLLERGVSRLHAHPAWYVHDDKSLHDDYWYLGFSEKFDCWDRNLSDHESEDEEEEAAVYTFILDAQLMARTPLNERLLFVMGGCYSPPLVCHESVLSLFLGQGQGRSGLQAISLPEA